MPNERCPKPDCGRLMEDHLCVTSRDGLAKEAEVDKLESKVADLTRTVEDLKGEIDHIRRHEKHRPVEIEPIDIRCRCGRSFHDWRSFHNHADEQVGT